MKPWWDYQSIDVCGAVEEYGMEEEVVIRRIELEMVEDETPGFWGGPPEPPVYEPKWEELIIVKPTRKWFGRVSA